MAGAGQMGAGIAQVSAVAGLDVVMIDVADEFIERGMAAIRKGLGRLVDKGRMEAADRDAALAAHRHRHGDGVRQGRRPVHRGRA